MREACIAHRLLHLIRDATLLAGDQRNRDLSRLARKHVADAFVDGGAHGIDRLPGGEVERRRARRLDLLDLARGVARGAEPREPSLAVEVEAPWLDRSGGG